MWEELGVGASDFRYQRIKNPMPEIALGMLPLLLIKASERETNSTPQKSRSHHSQFKIITDLKSYDTRASAVASPESNRLLLLASGMGCNKRKENVLKIR